MGSKKTSKSSKKSEPTPEPELTPKQLKEKNRQEARARAAESRKIVTAGTAAWTGKLPAQLLNETCQKNKWMPVDYIMKGRDESFIAIATVAKKHPKTNEVTRVRLDPPNDLMVPQKTPLEARHYAATYALHRIMSARNLKMMLPPAHRDFWVELDEIKQKASSHDKWKWSDDPFAAWEQKQKDRQEAAAKQKERSLYSEQKTAVSAVRSSIMQEQQEQKQQQEQSPATKTDEQPAKRIRFNSTLSMPKDVRIRLELLLQAVNGYKFSKSKTLTASENAHIVQVVSKLGFTEFQVSESLEYVSNINDCLAWLLVHVPEDDLPANFTPRHLDNSIRVASALSVEGATARIKQFGYSEQVALTAVQKCGNLAEAMAFLTNDLAEMPTSGKGEPIEFWSEELDSIKGMYPMDIGNDWCSMKLPPGCKVIFYRSQSYPACCPGIGLEIDQGRRKIPKYILLNVIKKTAEHAQMFLGDYMVLGIAQWLEEEFNNLVSAPCKLAQLSSAITGIREERSPEKPQPTKRRRHDRPKVDAKQLQEEHDTLFATRTGQDMLQQRKALPAWAKMQEIQSLVAKNAVTLVTGETGSGKSTQVVQFLLDEAIKSGTGQQVNIICTQPRRISAIGVAQRVANERLCELGAQVGYTIRGESKTSSTTQINFMTSGVLLRMIQSDAESLVNNVSHIVIDEVHERSLDSDFLLILLKRILARNPKVKVILMSATVDPAQFIDYFKPVSREVGYTHIEGRTFPVEKVYLNQILESTGYVPHKFRDEEKMPDLGQIIISMREGIDYSLAAATVQHIHKSLGSQSGSILIFMPGAAEIDRTISRIVDSDQGNDFWVLPLHAALAPKDQKLVFQDAPRGKRKIVVATNVAETSITISDIVAVVDSGRVKETEFDPVSNVQRLVDVWASRAAVTQRMGRAGRVRAGTCYKLYTENIESGTMVARPPPEMLRCPLDSLYLAVKSMGIENVPKFLAGALDPPPTDSLSAAMDNLRGYGAIDQAGALTPLGKHISLLPTDPQSAKLLILSSCFGCLPRGLSVAAIIGAKPPIVAPKDKRDEAKAVLKAFAAGNSSSSAGDLIAYVRAFDQWQSNTKCMSSSQVRAWCRDNFISPQACRDIQSAKRQLLGNLYQMGMVNSDQEQALNQEFTHNNHKDTLLNSVIAASLLPHVVEAVYPKKEFITTSTGAVEAARESARYLVLNPVSERVFLHPASSMFGENNLTPYLSYASSVITSKHFINLVSPLNIYGLLFFANTVQVDIMGNGIIIDGWTGLKCWPRVGILGQLLKSVFDELLARRFESPSINFQENNVIGCVLDLIESDGRAATTSQVSANSIPN